jgi:hypothetical protein
MLQAKKDKASSIIFHTRSNINFTLCDSSAKKIHMYISIFEFTRFRPNERPTDTSII